MILFIIYTSIFLIVLILAVSVAKQSPDEIWRKQERRYRQRGLVTQRPDNWGQGHRQAKIFIIGVIVIFALIVVAFVQSIAAL